LGPAAPRGSWRLLLPLLLCWQTTWLLLPLLLLLLQLPQGLVARAPRLAICRQLLQVWRLLLLQLVQLLCYHYY
jgi:hypothetical protein